MRVKGGVPELLMVENHCYSIQQTCFQMGVCRLIHVTLGVLDKFENLCSM